MTGKIPTIRALITLLADTYALQAQTQLAHWNVTGSGFFQLHEAFEAQYNALFKAVDELAERLRALGQPAPGGLKTLADLSSITEYPTKEAPAAEIVSHLVACYGIVTESAVKLRDTAAANDDPQTEDIAISRIQEQEKTLWMLESWLK
jgi:starvation-inducible DNA-binding protein